MEVFSGLTLGNSSTYVQDISLLLESVVGDPSKIGNYLSVQVLTAIVIVLGAINFADGIYFSLFKSMNSLYKIPAPPGLPLIGHLHQILFEKDIFRRFGEFSRQFKSYCRLQAGPKPIIMLTGPDAIEKLLSSNAIGHIKKADEYQGMSDYMDDGLVTSCGEKWRARRKIFSPLFNYKCFPHFLEVFNRHSKIFVKNLDEMFQDESPKPIQNALYESALKIICETAMGIELNDTTDEFDKFFCDAEKTKEFIWLKITRPWYRVKLIWNILPFRKEYEQNMKDIKDFMYKVIREARKKFDKVREVEQESGEVKRNTTVMDVLLGHGMSDPDIREEVHTIVSAGHETSASALQFTLMLLAVNPEHQEICQKEVDEIINDETKCPNGNFTMASLSDLKYIEQCIKESLRIFPIGYVFGRKLEASLDLGDGVVLPAGTTCVVAPADSHRNPDIFPDPEKFDPSRFTPENCASRHPYAYIPFSAGPRICLGYKYATAQMKLVLARILHHYTVHTTDRLDDVKMDLSCLLTPVRGYNFILKKRNPIPESV